MEEIFNINNEIKILLKEIREMGSREENNKLILAIIMRSLERHPYLTFHDLLLYVGLENCPIEDSITTLNRLQEYERSRNNCSKDASS